MRGSKGDRLGHARTPFGCVQMLNDSLPLPFYFSYIFFSWNSIGQRFATCMPADQKKWVAKPLKASSSRVITDWVMVPPPQKNGCEPLCGGR